MRKYRPTCGFLPDRELLASWLFFVLQTGQDLLVAWFVWIRRALAMNWDVELEFGPNGPIPPFGLRSESSRGNPTKFRAPNLPVQIASQTFRGSELGKARKERNVSLVTLPESLLSGPPPFPRRPPPFPRRPPPVPLPPAAVPTPRGPAAVPTPRGPAAAAAWPPSSASPPPRDLRALRPRRRVASEAPSPLPSAKVPSPPPHALRPSRSGGSVAHVHAPARSGRQRPRRRPAPSTARRPCPTPARAPAAA
nr:proline-rich receptor-like protein kinase PERK10 [Lolium perenne]